MPLHYKASYYPWITQNVAPKIIYENISILSKQVEGELSRLTGEAVTIEIMTPLEVPQQMKSIISGECQIAFMNPLGFIYANQVNSAVGACSVVERKIKDAWGTKYYTQVYTNKKTAIKEGLFGLSKGEYTNRLKGKSIGFGTPFSTSNFIVPAFELTKRNIKPLTVFSRIEFLGGHEVVARAVYKGEVDLGAGHDGVIVDLSNQYGYGDAGEILITLLTADIPSDPVAVNLPDQEAFVNLQLALERASKTPEGEKAISAFWGGARHLLPISTTVYSSLLDAATALNLSREDIFGF